MKKLVIHYFKFGMLKILHVKDDSSNKVMKWWEEIKKLVLNMVTTDNLVKPV